MKITICCSLKFAKEIIEVGEKLKKMGHVVLFPRTAELIKEGKVSQDFVDKGKETEEFTKFSITNNATKKHFEKIRDSEGILVLNFDKNNIENYIGGGVFLEMGCAFAFDKKRRKAQVAIGSYLNVY